MSLWIHTPTDGKHWTLATEFEPPLPRPIPGLGYPYYFVEIDGFTFEFASLAELETLIETFSKKLLPSNWKLTIQFNVAHGYDYGLNGHWLNRIPKAMTPWRYRQKAVKYLRLAFNDFERQITVA